MPQQELISSIPSAAELELMYSPNRTASVEPFNLSLVRGYNSDQHDPDALNQTLLHNLGNELQWGSSERQDELIANAYTVARHFGDMALLGQSPKAFSALDNTRSHARFNVKFTSHSEHSGHIKTFVANDGRMLKEMGVSVNAAYADSGARRVAEARLAQAGAEVRSQDLSLLILLQNTGHEAGHVIQLGIEKVLSFRVDSQQLRDIDKTYHSSAYSLISDPTKGKTGDLKTDSQIHAERFAEGYGMVVMTEAARAMGYDAKTVDALARALAITEVDPTSKYAGEPGYTMPLDSQELAADLEEFDELFVQPAAGQVMLSQQVYAAGYAEVERSIPKKLEQSQDYSRRARISRMLGRLTTRLKTRQ